MRRLFIILSLLATCGTWTGLRAQATTSAQQDKTHLLLILDCSNSMWDKWQSDSKIKVTQQVLLRLLDSIEGQNHIDMALRVFGHLNNHDLGTQLEVPFGPDNLYKLRSKIKTLVPNGGCTAASALNNSLKDFPRDAHSRNIILIITDGLDECDGNICDVARQVNGSGSVVQTFIIGIGSPENFKSQLDCAGRFTLLTDEERFAETLYQIFLLSDQKALLTLDVVDADRRPYETDIPLALFDHATHTLRDATIHHFGSDSPVDTLEVDPLLTYDITLATKPPVQLNDQHFTPGRHTRLQIVAPQGTLRLHLPSKRTAFQMPDYTVLVRRHGDPAILATQRLGATEHYLAGAYDIDILSLPVLHLDNVSIRSGSDTDMQIPLPGQLALTKPPFPTTGSIFALQADGLRWVCDLDPTNMNERIVFMPGTYQVVLRPADDSSYDAVQTAQFTIHSGQQTGLTLK